MTVVALCLERINPTIDTSIPIFSLVLVTLALYVLGIKLIQIFKVHHYLSFLGTFLELMFNINIVSSVILVRL